MRLWSMLGAAGLALAVATAGCGLRKPAGPTREAVTALLQQEANSLKADGEKLDPVLRVRATWTVEGLDVVERPNDADRPWSGKIRFKIKSENPEVLSQRCVVDRRRPDRDVDLAGEPGREPQGSLVGRTHGDVLPVVQQPLDFFVLKEELAVVGVAQDQSGLFSEDLRVARVAHDPPS